MEEDFSNYSVTVESPIHTVYRGKRLTHCHAAPVKMCSAWQGAVTAFNGSQSRTEAPAAKSTGEVLPCPLPLVHGQQFRGFPALWACVFLHSDHWCFDSVRM